MATNPTMGFRRPQGLQQPTDNPMLQRILGGVLGPAQGYGGLLGDDEKRAAQQQGLLALGAQMLQASGPSPVKTSLGQALGSGIQAGQQAQQSSLQQALQAQLMQSQIAKANAPKIVRVDRGDKVDLVDERSGEVVASLPKGASPDAQLREEGATSRHLTPSGSAQLGAQTTIRGQDLGSQTAMRGQDVTMRGQDLSTETARRGQDMQQSSRDAKSAQEERARQLRAQQVISTANSTLVEIDKALALADKSMTTGFLGSQMSNIRGTDAFTLRETVGTIKANIGFDRLQAMREASPTGGALGQVAVQELEALQNSIAALDPGLPDDVLIENLKKVKAHYENWRDAVEQAGGAPQGGSDPALDDVMSRYIQGQ